jgi:hypothetical protein
MQEVNVVVNENNSARVKAASRYWQLAKVANGEMDVRGEFKTVGEVIEGLRELSVPNWPSNRLNDRIVGVLNKVIMRPRKKRTPTNVVILPLRNMGPNAAHQEATNKSVGV